MRRAALKSLFFERGKAIASLAGVACASTLLFVEAGIKDGLASTSSALIRRAGATTWLVSRGTEVLDNGQALPATAASRLRALGCAARVRGLIVVTLPVKKPSGSVDWVQVVGSDAGDWPRLPWSVAQGDAAALAPGEVTLDETEAEKLGVTPKLGVELEVAAQKVKIGATTRGIRSFALFPYLFTTLETARSLAGMSSDAATYFLADGDAACQASIAAAFKGDPDVTVLAAARFTEMTERYWMEGSGAGLTLTFSALFSLLVGAVTIGQTLFSLTRDHLEELATLKVMGARPAELVSFVAWQCATLGAAGGLLGLAIAATLSRALAARGVTIALSPSVLATGAAAVAIMCVLAALPSVWSVHRVSPLSVLR